MLSRSLNKSSSVVIASPSASCAAFLSSAKRTSFVYTCQSGVLINNSKHLNFTSPVWVEESDDYWWKKVTELKSPDERPTELLIPRLFEYYNLECLADPTKLEGYDAATMMTNASTSSSSSTPSTNKKSGNAKGKNEDNHRSWRTRLPFRNSVNEDFEAAARLHNYTQSKYWITVNEVRKQKLALQRSSRVTGVLMHSSARLFNADQFKHPEKIAKAPASGYKRRLYGGTFAEYLVADVAANGYKTGLYFTMSQLELFGLSSKLRADAVPAEIPLTNDRGSQTLFNLDDVENSAKVLAELNRFPIEDGSNADYYLISGRPVHHAATAAKMKELKSARGSHLKSCYWSSEQDLISRGYKLKGGAKGVDFVWEKVLTVPRTLLLYNADQLVVPEEAFKIAGTKSVL